MDNVGGRVMAIDDLAKKYLNHLHGNVKMRQFIARERWLDDEIKDYLLNHGYMTYDRSPTNPEDVIVTFTLEAARVVQSLGYELGNMWPELYSNQYN